MIYTFPHYYKKFHCIAGACRDTCCAGWQIMIDEKSLRKYRRLKGGLGNRLHNSIDWEEKCFEQYGGRCAFLNEENLCDLYAEGGPDMLCRTCREYPRHTEEFEGLREISLSLSCEEAARIILGCKERVRFVSVERPGEEEYGDFDFLLYTKLADCRDLMLGILQRRELPVSLRLSMALALGHDLQRRLDRGEIFDVDGLLARYGAEGASERFERRIAEYGDPDGTESAAGGFRFHAMKELFGVFDGLEVLKDSWPGYLGDIRNALFGAGEEAYLENRRRVFEAAAGEPRGGDMAPACGCDQWELWSEQLAVYFVFTYFCGAVYDGRPYEKVKLAVVSTLLITEMMRGRRILQGGRLSLEDAAEAAHRYSREVEHSDHNLRVLERAFLRQPEFRLENLIRLLRP